MTRGGRDRATVTGWLRDLGRTAQWHRRLLSAGLLAGAVALGLHAVRPPPPATVPVLAAARDLPAGARLGPADLTVVRHRPAAVPTGALRSPRPALGATLVSAARAGELLTDVRMVSAGAVRALGPHLVATPVRLADAETAALLRPGTVVDVLAAGAAVTAGEVHAPARLVAAGVRVLTLPRPDHARLGASVGEGALVVLATTEETAARLAGAAVTERLSVVLRGR